MTYSVTPGLYPSNTGWSFPDPLTGVLIHGENLVDLVHKLTRYRSTNHLESGDPEAEVTTYVCRNNPMLCRQENRKVPGSAVFRMDPAPGNTPLFERALDWARRLVMGPSFPALPAVEELNRRSAACRVCPHNVRTDGCISCRIEGRVMVDQLSKGVPARLGTRLKICDHYGWFNKAAIVHGGGIDPSAPDGCWKKP